MAIDYNQRPAGMSKREYAASILGGSKEDYDSSGNKKSASSSSSKVSSSSGSTYKAKEYKYTDFVDTKPVESAYAGAKETYLTTLTALKPRYEELYKQLEAEKTLAAEKETALAGEEQTLQKSNLAKRGIATDTSNQFYTTEKGKLESQQLMRSKETALQYAGKRLDISGAESADTRDITTAIANLDLSKANTISSMVTAAKNTAANLNSAEASRALESAQWEKTYAYNKSKDEADRALSIYKMAKDESKSKNDSYKNALASIVTDAYTSTKKDDYSTPGIRENIVIAQLKTLFPDVSSSQIEKDVNNMMPNGWEAYGKAKSSGSSVKKIGTDSNGEDIFVDENGHRVAWQE